MDSYLIVGKIFLCRWFISRTWTFNLKSRHFCLFARVATYIFDSIGNCGVGRASSRSSSIEDKSSKRRSKESAGSSHAGEHAKGWCQEGELEHLNLWSCINSGSVKCFNLPAWKMWRQARRRGRSQTWRRQLCKTRSRSRRSLGMGRRLPRRVQGRSWRERRLLDDPWQLRKQSFRRCWRTQSMRWEEQTRPWTIPSAEWSGHRH